MIQRLGSFKKGTRPEITVLSARPMNDVNFTDKQLQRINQTTENRPIKEPSNENQSGNQNPVIGYDIPPPPKTAPPPKPARKQRPTSEIYNGFMSIKSVKTANVDVDSMKNDSSKLGRSKSLYSPKKPSSRENPVRPAPPPPSHLRNGTKDQDPSSSSVGPVRTAPSVPFVSFNKKIDVERPHEAEAQSQGTKKRKKRSQSASHFSDRHKTDAGIHRSASTLPRGKHTPDPVHIITEDSDEFIVLGRRKSLEETRKDTVKLKSFGVSKSTSDVCATASFSKSDMPARNELNKTEITAVVNSELVKQTTPQIPEDRSRIFDNSQNPDSSISQNLGQGQSQSTLGTCKEPVTLQDAINASAILARLKQANESEDTYLRDQSNAEASNRIFDETHLVTPTTAAVIDQNKCDKVMECENLNITPETSKNQPDSKHKNCVKNSESSVISEAERNNNKDIPHSIITSHLTSEKCLYHVTSTLRDDTKSANASNIVNAIIQSPNKVSSDISRNGNSEALTKNPTPASMKYRSPKRPSPPSVKPKPKLSNGPSPGQRLWSSFDNGASCISPSKNDSIKNEESYDFQQRSSPLIIKADGSSAGKIFDQKICDMKPGQRFGNRMTDGSIANKTTMSPTFKDDIITAPLIIKAGSFKPQNPIEAMGISSKEGNMPATMSNGDGVHESEDRSNVTTRNTPLIIKASKENRQVARVEEQNAKSREGIIELEGIDLRSMQTANDIEVGLRTDKPERSDISEDIWKDSGAPLRKIALDKPAQNNDHDHNDKETRSADRKKSESEAESTGSVDSLSSVSSQVTVIMNPNATLPTTTQKQNNTTGLPFDSQEPNLRKKSLPEPYSSHKERRPKPGKQPPVTATVKSRNRKSRLMSGRRLQTSPPSTPPPPPKINPDDKKSSVKKTERPPVPPRVPSMVIQNDMRSLDALTKGNTDKKGSTRPVHTTPPQRPAKPTLFSRAATFDVNNRLSNNKELSNVNLESQTAARESQTAVRESQVAISQSQTLVTESQAAVNTKPAVSSKVEMFNRASEKPKRPPMLWKQKSLETKVESSEHIEPPSVEQLRLDGKEALEMVAKLREKSGFVPKKPKRPLSFSMENFVINNLVQPSSETNDIVNPSKKKAPAKPSRPLSFIKATSMDAGCFELNFHNTEVNVKQSGTSSKMGNDYVNVTKTITMDNVNGIKEETEKTVDETVYSETGASSKETAGLRNEPEAFAKETRQSTEVTDVSTKETEERLSAGNGEIQSNVGTKVSADQKQKSVPQKPVRTSSLRKKRPLVIQKQRIEKIEHSLPETDSTKKNLDEKIGEECLDKKINENERKNSVTCPALSNQIEKLDEIINQTTLLKEKLSDVTKEKFPEPAIKEMGVETLNQEEMDCTDFQCDTNLTADVVATESWLRDNRLSQTSSDSTETGDNFEKDISTSDKSVPDLIEIEECQSSSGVITEKKEQVSESLLASGEGPFEESQSSSGVITEKKEQVSETLLASGEGRFDDSKDESKYTEPAKSQPSIANSTDSNQTISCLSSTAHDENTTLLKKQQSTDKPINLPISCSEPSVESVEKLSTKTPPSKPPRPVSFPKVRNTEYLFAFREHLDQSRKQVPPRPTSLPFFESEKRYSTDETETPQLSNELKQEHESEPVYVPQQSPVRALRPPIPDILRDIANGNTPPDKGLMNRLKEEMDVKDPHCVALFDYTGETTKDLSFKAGDLIILEKQVNREWFYGSLHEVKGMFPSSFVEVIIDLPFQEKPTEESAIEDILVHINKPHALGLFSFVAGNDDELTFETGDTIDLISRLDEDWYQGSCKGRTGIFPANFVAVVQPLPNNVTDKEAGIEKENNRENRILSTTNCDLSGRFCTAVVDFNSDVDGDLSFKTGQDIRIISSLNADWLKGVLHNKTGIFPRNSVKILDKCIDSKDCSADETSTPKARATKDYTATRDGELSFKIDDIIILKRKLEDGWMEGELNNSSGRLHESYIEILVPL